MNNYGEYGRCEATAKSTGVRCKRPAVGEHGKCGFHGGNTPTKDENPNVGAPEGNSRAEGNDGGAPAGNMNALSSGLHADPVNLFEWLLEEDRDAAVWILNKLYSYSRDAPKPVYETDLTPGDVDSFEDARMHLTAYGTDVLQLCIRDYARWKATKRQLQEGIISEQEEMTEQGVWTTEDSNPVNLDLSRMDKDTTRQKDKLGLLPSSDSGGNDENLTLVEILKEPEKYPDASLPELSDEEEDGDE